MSVKRYNFSWQINIGLMLSVSLVAAIKLVHFALKNLKLRLKNFNVAPRYSRTFSWTYSKSITRLSQLFYRNTARNSPVLSPVMISSDNYVWVEITDEFFNAIKGKCSK